MRLAHQRRTDEKAADVNGKHVVVQIARGIHPFDQIGILHGKPFEKTGRVLQQQRYTRSKNQQSHQNHQTALQGVGEHVRVGTAEENVAGDEGEHDHQGDGIGHAEKLLHDDGKSANDEHHKGEREQIDQRKEGSETARTEPVADPVRHGEGVRALAQPAEAKGEHHQHEAKSAADGDDKMHERRQPVNIDKAGIDNESGGGGHAGRHGDAHHERRQVAAANGEAAKRGGFAKAAPAQIGRADHVQQKQRPCQGHAIPSDPMDVYDAIEFNIAARRDAGLRQHLRSSRISQSPSSALMACSATV